MKVLPADQQELARKLGLKLDYDFNGESYLTVSGQNSNNSVRIPNSFFKALEDDADWKLTHRVTGKVAKTMKARKLWDEISFAAWRCADPGVQYDTTINQWHTCPNSGRINASNPCVTGDTRVLTPGGVWRRIDSMIHLPARVITNVDGKQVHVVDGAFPTGTRECYELRTEDGYTVKLTADHKVWTKNRGWQLAKDLTTVDELRLLHEPACVEEVGEPADAKVFQLAGMLVSDANGVVTKLQLDACLRDEALVDDFAQYVHDTWQLEAQSEGSTLTKTFTNRRLLSRLGMFIRVDRSTGVRLSDDAFTAGLAAQKHLLRGLFSADAVVDGATGSVTLRHRNRHLIEDVQLLLGGFGIQSTIESTGGAGGLGGALEALGNDAADPRHGLRIKASSLRLFHEHIGFLGGEVVSDQWSVTSESEFSENWTRLASLTPIGLRPVFDLTEPVTSSFVANGLTVHNCSEYMFLDDTACNLASLNVMRFFDPEKKSFDVESYRHGIRLWTIVLEISVLMASFPSEAIAQLSYKFRTLGLGYANLGALLMQAGIPYDSEKGRAFCGAVTAVLTGESYATSAEMAAQLGTFPGYGENKEAMLRVVRNHRRAAYNAPNYDYEQLDVKPVGIDAGQFAGTDPLVNTALLQSARACWDKALDLGSKHGYRNAQTTVIAPTGTIGLLMDCDTTGVEPDFALVKFKKLAGGGYFKIANQSVEPALRNLGYSDSQIHEILQYVLGTLTLKNVPHINYDSLLAKGFTDAELKRIEDSLPGMFELGFAFSAWSLGKPFMDRLGIPESEWQAPGFNLLRKLGFKKKQIDEASAVICGRGTVEGAPHLKSEHLAVFDCANKCGKDGQRFIAVEGHIRMMAAAQPFISGAISKTINLPNEANIDEIKDAYKLSWELGLKANALYRDGSKLSQPLNVKSDADIDDEESEENVEAAKDALATDLASGVSSLATHDSRLATESNIEAAPDHTRVIERIVERPLRRRLPDTRNAITHKFDISGHEGYVTVGLYEDGTPGEVFITMSKEGSTIGGLMDTIATLVSVALQYGVPVESLVRKFEHVRFEPSGMTRNQDIPFAKSPVDYIFRWLAMEFVEGYRANNAPQRDVVKSDSVDEVPLDDTGVDRHMKKSNGHGTRMDVVDKDPTDITFQPVATKRGGIATTTKVAPKLDGLSQQTGAMQSDAPPCGNCGAITVRSASCYKCLNCGTSQGCS
jgi:ribonucleoside-diphosphate reductase alpha chain